MNFYLYYTGALGLCLISILALFENLKNKPNPLFTSNFIYLTAVCIFLIINKLAFFYGGMIDIDESLMLNAGRTFSHYPLPWISVDPTTSGPLNFLPATLLIKLFNDASYGELRILYVIAFQIPTLIISFFTINKIAGPHKARLALIPLTLCFAFLFFADHTHSSSEQFPMLFTAVGLCGVIRIAYDNVGRWQLGLTGSVCAIAPFTKLQVAPLLFFIFFVCFALIVIKKRPRKEIIWLGAGFLITGFVTFLFIFSYGGFYDFLQSYIYSNIKYSKTHYSPQSTVRFVKISIAALLPILLFLSFLAFLFIQARKRNSSILKSDYLHLLIFVLILLVGIYCVIKPGRFFPHYAMLLVIPLYGCFLWMALRSTQFNNQQIPHLLIIVSLILLFNVYLVSRSDINTQKSKVANIEILNLLIAEGKPIDRLAVWGWGSLYVHEAAQCRQNI